VYANSTNACAPHLSSDHEADDAFDAETVALVEPFNVRGVSPSPASWISHLERLGEARWQLGERLLYLTRPYLRGDDVAELQVLLAQLGFNPGRIDGIFGPQLDSALSEFQRNCALESSGALTKATLQELIRVRTTNANRSLVTDARDLAGFNPLATGSIVLCGEGPSCPARSIARRLAGDPRTHQHFTRRVLGLRQFPRRGARVVVSNSRQRRRHPSSLLASYRAHSRRGEL